MDVSIGLLFTAISSVVFFISFINSNAGLSLLIASILISPEVKLFEIPDRTVAVRLSDLVILFIFLGWLGRMAIQKSQDYFKKSPLNLPIMIFSLMLVFSTLFGIYKGTVSPLRSLLFLFKRLQYFFIFFIVLNNTKTLKQIRVSIAFILLSTLVIDMVGYYQRLKGLSSVYGTFGNIGQSNVLGGYFMTALFLSIGLLFAYRWRIKILILLLILLTFINLLFTTSRGSNFSFAAAFIITGLLIRRFKLVFIFIILACLFILSLPLLPKDLAFGVTSSVRILPGQEDPSWSARLYAWDLYLPRFYNNPFFGYGLSSLPLGFVDNQYVMELLDTGMVGLFGLLWLFWKIFKSLYSFYRNNKDLYARSLAFGVLGGFIAMLIHALTITNFYTIRLMETFWFLLGITMAYALILGQHNYEQNQ